MLDVKQMIQDSGIKFEKVAEKLGISRQTLWAKVNGHRAFTKTELQVLLDILSTASSDGSVNLVFTDDDAGGLSQKIIDATINRPICGTVVDPKGELVRSIDDALKDYGYTVVPLNLIKEKKDAEERD